MKKHKKISFHIKSVSNLSHSYYMVYHCLIYSLKNKKYIGKSPKLKTLISLSRRTEDRMVFHYFADLTHFTTIKSFKKYSIMPLKRLSCQQTPRLE